MSAKFTLLSLSKTPTFIKAHMIVSLHDVFSLQASLPASDPNDRTFQDINQNHMNLPLRQIKDGQILAILYCSTGFFTYFSMFLYQTKLCNIKLIHYKLKPKIWNMKTMSSPDLTWSASLSVKTFSIIPPLCPANSASETFRGFQRVFCFVLFCFIISLFLLSIPSIYSIKTYSKFP